jgi:hypothetical protein
MAWDWSRRKEQKQHDDRQHLSMGQQVGAAMSASCEGTELSTRPIGATSWNETTGRGDRIDTTRR